MKSLVFFTAASAILFPCAVSAACLQEAGDFAERICGQVKTMGKSTLITADGNLSAEAKGLLARALGQLSGNTGVDVKTDSFDNVLHEQLEGELVNVRKCGIEMAKAAMTQVCTRAASWKTCENQAFGIASWGGNETLNGTSGWRGGGYNPDAYCTDFINGVVQSRSLGNVAHLISNVRPSEERRRSGFMNSHAEYNYHCSIEIHWNPIYNQRTDPICGVE